MLLHLVLLFVIALTGLIGVVVAIVCGAPQLLIDGPCHLIYTHLVVLTTISISCVFPP